MSEDDFHEIQLNGKQLVFLFMSATVVAVVIFLCGVMVGRGVRVPRSAEPVEAAAEPASDPTASAQPAPVATTTEGTPAAAQETLTYPDRLEDPAPPPETLRDAAAKTTQPAPKTASQPPASAPAPATPAATPRPSPATPATAAPVATASAPAPAPRTPAVATASEPKGTGYVVQVAATRDRGEADTIAKRLAGKGYPAFVTSGGARMFRVRVGKYADRREAESVAHKLQKDEQFKPWVTK